MDPKLKQEAARRIKLTLALSGEEPIPFMDGRPIRDKVIKKDDIINLKILLNTCRDWDQFLYTC